MVARSGSYFGSTDRVVVPHRTDSFQQHQLPHQRHNRSQSLEQSGAHSPSSSSSSNSYMSTDRNSLRQSTQPKFQISGDLNPQQISIVKRTWKQVRFSKHFSYFNVVFLNVGGQIHQKSVFL